MMGAPTAAGISHSAMGGSSLQGRRGHPVFCRHDCIHECLADRGFLADEGHRDRIRRRILRAGRESEVRTKPGRWAICRQEPDARICWCAAEAFAWAIGLVLATAMMYLVVLQNVRGPINLIVCSICLLLLFFETAFGICIGREIYNLFNRDKAQLCPGGACEVRVKQKIQRIGLAQAVVALGFLGIIAGAASVVGGKSVLTRPQELATAATDQPVSAEEAERCKVPAFAVAIGHIEKWKLHNNCK
jgi:Domain of unknown function (DUF4395)